MENKYTEQTFSVECKGRDPHGQEILPNPVGVTVKMQQSPHSNTISSIVTCMYNTGGHGQRCKASHPESDKVGDGVLCPYSLDIPYVLDRK